MKNYIVCIEVGEVETGQCTRHWKNVYPADTETEAIQRWLKDVYMSVANVASEKIQVPEGSTCEC